MKIHPTVTTAKFRYTTILRAMAINLLVAAQALAAPGERAPDTAGVVQLAQQQARTIQPITQQTGEQDPVASASAGRTLDLVVGVQQPLQVGKTLTRVAVATPPSPTSC